MDNYSKKSKLQEFAFGLTLKRVFNIGYKGHVDLRSPNFAASDYIVVDFNGKLYPSDEARMISRIGVIDLSIGDLFNGINKKIVNQFNWDQVNETNPDCIHCAYQPYCGIDSVDELSRYNRIDIPKNETAFCENHMSKFNDIFSRILSNDPVNIYNITGHLTGNYKTDPPYGQIVYD